MSATADDSEESHRYFRAIEETFIRLRGAPLLLSPADWQAAREWRRQGIPLEVVQGALEELFARLAAADPERRVNSLRYCAPAVREAWSEARELDLARRGEVAPPLDPEPRLRALARSLPPSLPGRVRLADEIGSLGGGVEEIESRLRSLDGELLARARQSLSSEEAAALEEEVDRRLAAVGRRLPAAEVAVTREHLERQALRHRLGLPWLSLFSPDAAGDSGEEPG